MNQTTTTNDWKGMTDEQIKEYFDQELVLKVPTEAGYYSLEDAIQNYSDLLEIPYFDTVFYKELGEPEPTHVHYLNDRREWSTSDKPYWVEVIVEIEYKDDGDEDETITGYNIITDNDAIIKKYSGIKSYLKEVRLKIKKEKAEKKRLDAEYKSFKSLNENT